MTPPALQLRDDDGIAIVTIDQPESKANVLSPALWAELETLLTTIAPRPYRGLIFTSGKPGVFIAGADLRFLADAMTNNPPAIADFIAQGQRVLLQLEALPFPTIAAIDGAALGGGLELALACDGIVMGSHPKTQLGLPEIKLGLIPGWGGTQRLPRLVGIEEALDRLLSGESYATNDPPPDDVALLVNSDDLLTAASTALAQVDLAESRALKREPLAPDEMLSKDDLASVKASLDALDPATLPAAVLAIQVVLLGCTKPLADALALETDAFLRLTQTDEAKQLVADFFAKRKR